MNTLATLFAGIIALFSGLFGHTAMSTQSQQVSVPATATTTQQNSKIVETNVSTSSSLQLDGLVIWSDEKHKYTSGNGNVYFDGLKIEDAEQKSFQIIDQNPFPTRRYSGENIAHYSKDKNKVYYDGKVIQSADGTSFVVVWPDVLGTEQVYAQDVSNSYYKGEVILPKVDSASFKPLGVLSNGWRVGGNYSRDKSHIYYKSAEVIGADLSTFNSEYEDGYAADKNKVFLEGVVVPNMDPKKFIFPVHEP
ncbi:MAG: DKNYY domain-containing protein [Candidatus Paceibacterota bacterium]